MTDVMLIMRQQTAVTLSGRNNVFNCRHTRHLSSTSYFGPGCFVDRHKDSLFKGYPLQIFVMLFPGSESREKKNGERGETLGTLESLLLN